MTPIERAATEPAIIYPVRRRNLRKLIEQHAGGNVAAFADQFGYSRSRVSQFLSDTYNDGRSIGERAARAMEEAAGVPLGWLDDSATASTAGADEPLRTRMLQLAGEVAAAKDQVARVNAECDRLRNSDNEARIELGAAINRNYQLEEQVQVLALFGAPAPAAARAEGAPPPAGLICELVTQEAVFARKLADLQQRGYHVLGHILHKDGEYALMDGSCRWLTQPQYQRLMHEQDGSLFATSAPVDHATELCRAISETRIVFESEPVAGDVLSYLESVLTAGTPVPAQTGIAGGGGASIAEETVTVAGTEPVAGGDWRAAYGRLRATYMDLAQRYDELEAEMAAMTSTAADQAAAAMAAESAQLAIEAEKTAARAAVRAAVDPLAVLSREVFSLADKLQQPADLVVQLLVLADLRTLASSSNCRAD